MRVWEWQYWPDIKGTDFIYEKGSANSIGLNGTWHQYSIVPNTAGGWSFLLDGHQVSFVSNSRTNSSGPAYFVAEKGSDSSNPGTLGPVEFRNLAYLKGDGWHYATALYALVGCALNTNCNVGKPYGVMSEGSGAVVAGTGISQPKDLDLLWMGVVGGVTLTLEMPSQVTATIDNQFAGSGHSQLSLSLGLHTIQVPQVVDLDSKNRLRFDHWSGGSASSTRTFTMVSDTTLRAVYVTQHLLTIDSIVPLSGAGWYDEGTTASFSEPNSILIHPGLGILGGQWAFDGWYEDGVYLSTSPSSSIVMDRSHTLQLRWYQDYTVPISISIGITALMAVFVFLVTKHKRSQISS